MCNELNENVIIFGQTLITKTLLNNQIDSKVLNKNQH